MHPLLAAQEARARELVDPAVLTWIDDGTDQPGAAGGWSSYRFRPHVLRDVSSVTTTATVLGTAVAAPVLVGPTAFHDRVHPDAERATAAGAAAAGSLMVWSMRASVPFEGTGWWQAYVLQDRAITLDACLRARDLGATAVVLTGDTPYLGTARRAPLGDLDQAPATLQDIDWLTTRTGLPVLVKGVLRRDDAEACLDAGAAGLVVSNHGGRQLGRTVSTAAALSEVVDAVAGRAPVLVDGAIRSGLDLLVALALGADAVLLGKPVLWGLASGGSAGVETCLRAVADDLAHVMGLAGCATVADVDASLVTAPNGWT
ncbi:MAG: alpha-hydroxy acid dehydrogenase [Frankiales bacterium]|nr:alpha-hydroxy acid dehydrogenase [Frankiales bacterium]